MRLYGLLGHQIGFSLSPKLHNFSANLLGIEATYVPFDISPVSLESAMKVFWDMGVAGLNVTTPYKAAVVPLLASAPLGPIKSAVNTLHRGKSGWEATSTDVEGLALAIGRLGANFSGFRRYIILGDGGAAFSILEHIVGTLTDNQEVFILSRNPKRHQHRQWPATLCVKFVDFEPRVFDELVQGAAEETLVIQASSAPVRGDNLERFTEAFKLFSGVFVDLVYSQPSALLAAAQARGLPCQDGLPMLIEQARLAQHLWWGQSCGYEELYQFINKLK